MGALDAEYRCRMRIRPATPDDTNAIFDLLTLRSRAAFGVSSVARADVARSLDLPATDAYVAEDRGIVGFAALEAFHAVDIATRDDAANDALLDIVLARARERGFDTVHAVVVPEDVLFHTLVQRAGFTHHNDVLRMWRALDGDLPSPEWPADVTVRTYEDDDGAAVHDLLDAAYSVWDDTYAPRPHDDWLQFMTQHDDFDPRLWLLVERDGGVVACALHWKEHQGRGWVKDIVVRESERGRGLAKALLHEGFRAYSARGADRVGLKVDSTNPTGALQLYARTGFVTDRTYGTWVKQL
jgi:ribosomal protein S18 acetylase RimI-like enzyme